MNAVVAEGVNDDEGEGEDEGGDVRAGTGKVGEEEEEETGEEAATEEEDSSGRLAGWCTVVVTVAVAVPVVVD